MRPGSITWFERINLLGLALAVSTEILLWDQTRLQAAQEDTPVAMVLSILAASYALWLLLTLAVSRWRSSVFRWIYTAVTLLGLLGVALMLVMDELESSLLDRVILLTQCGFSAVALVFLFRPDSTSWLVGRDPVDPEIFH